MVGDDKAAKPRIVVAGHLPISTGIDRFIRVTERSMKFERGARIDTYMSNRKQFGTGPAFAFNPEELPGLIELSDNAVHLRKPHAAVPIRSGRSFGACG